MELMACASIRIVAPKSQHSSANFAATFVTTFPNWST